jgi:hypothetical protein
MHPLSLTPSMDSSRPSAPDLLGPRHWVDSALPHRHLTNVWYEREIHAPIAKQIGLKGELVEELQRVCLEIKWLDDRQMAVLAYVDMVTRNMQVLDEVFEKVMRVFGDKDVVN